MRRRVLRMVLAVLFGAGLVLPMAAQHTSAGVDGTVTDATGSMLPDAHVVLTNVETNVSARATTNKSGYFAFVNVNPGQYKMAITKQGFKSIVVPPFQLVVDQTFTTNNAMQVGAVNETVTVDATSEGALLQKSSSELGNVIEAKEITNLPLNGRNFTQLMILSPGVNPVSTAQGSGISTTDAGITAIPGTAFFKPSFFGQQNRETFYLMDGIVNTDLRGAIYGYLPIIDAMQEFKMQSHMDDAQFGVVTGGVVNMLSRSGTNQFHGSVWEFIRNNVFDARNSFSDFCSVGRCAPGTPTTTPAPPGHYTQNQFGAAVGGPILRNKLFFFGAYEGWRYSKPVLSQTLVPTSQELGGDFSSPTYSFYQNAIYNPYSTACAGTNCTVQQFKCDTSGNPITPAANGTQTGGANCLKIPSSMLNATMLAYIKAYYLPANSQSSEASGYNFIENRPNIDNNNSYQVRVDFHKSDKNIFFGRVSQMWVFDTSPIAGTVGSNVSNYHAYNFGGGYTHVFGPNLILDVRGGAMLKPYAFSQANAPNGYKPAQDAGFTNPGQYGGMYINLATPYSGSNAGHEGTLYRGNPVVNGGGSATWIKGSHTLKFGVDYIYQNRLQRNLYQQFTFTDFVTSNNSASKTGNSLASAVLALPATFTAQDPVYSEDFFSMSLWSGYVQDSWRATAKLTINVGLRYDYLPNIHMLNNRLANGLDIPNQRYIIQNNVGACTTTFTNPCIPGGIGSVPNSANIVFANGGQQVGPPISDNIGPRLGFAYQPYDKTVVNGGVGILYDTITARSQWVQNNIEGPTWPWTTGISSQPVNVSQNSIYPGGPGNPLTLITQLEGNFPNPVIAATPWLSTGGGYVSAPNFSDQRAVEYNLQVQQQAGPKGLFSIGYAGSKSTRLPFTGYANAASQPSPSSTPKTTVDTYRYMPWMTPAWHYSTSTGYGNYNALLAQFQRRMTQSLNTIISYTWAKSMDNSSGWFNAENGTGGGSVVQSFFLPRNAYGISSYDVRNVFVWSTVYGLPFGKGQRWVQTGWLSYLVGGWTANYAFAIRSGQPYGLNVGGDVANISGSVGTAVTSYSRPNVVGNPLQGSCGSTPIGKRGANGFCEFNPTAFAVPSGSYGNMGKMPYRVRSYNNLDFSLVKDTPLFEQVKLQLRAESFNTYNAVIPGNPANTTIPTSTGATTTQGNTPRELQFAAKITF